MKKILAIVLTLLTISLLTGCSRIYEEEKKTVGVMLETAEETFLFASKYEQGDITDIYTTSDDTSENFHFTLKKKIRVSANADFLAFQSTLELVADKDAELEDIINCFNYISGEDISEEFQSTFKTALNELIKAPGTKVYLLIENEKGKDGDINMIATDTAINIKLTYN